MLINPASSDLRTKEEVVGPIVTWEMVVAEGWNKPKGDKGILSKWETIPELMFMYRSASFFARVYDPAALLGFKTTEEIEDIYPQEIDVSPPDKKQVAEEEEKAKQDAIQRFKDFIPGKPGPIEEGSPLARFLKQTAEANRSSVDDIMVAAASDLERFWLAYEKWTKKSSENLTGDAVPPKKEPANPEPATSKSEPAASPEGGGLPFDRDDRLIPKTKTERCQYLEKAYPDIYRKALENQQIGMVMSEAAAVLVSNEFDRLFKQRNHKK